jgi:hypothetical protein
MFRPWMSFLRKQAAPTAPSSKRTWQMLRSLRDTQAAFADHLAGNDRLDLLAAIDGDPRTAARRLQVHLNQTRLSLVAALAATFRTVEAVVGQEYFASLARQFVAETALEGPVLSAYGERFDRFISDSQELHGLAYLADVARLDWALNEAFHAPAEAPLTAADLTALPVTCLAELPIRLPMGSSLIESDYPLDLIWQASQPGTPVESVDLAAGPSRLLVFRRPGDAAFAVLSSGEAAFIKGLSRQKKLATAARYAGCVDRDFDLATTFGAMLGLGRLAVGPT